MSLSVFVLIVRLANEFLWALKLECDKNPMGFVNSTWRNFIIRMHICVYVTRNFIQNFVSSGSNVLVLIQCRICSSFVFRFKMNTITKYIYDKTTQLILIMTDELK